MKNWWLVGNTPCVVGRGGGVAGRGRGMEPVWFGAFVEGHFKEDRPLQ